MKRTVLFILGILLGFALSSSINMKAYYIMGIILLFCVIILFIFMKKRKGNVEGKMEWWTIMVCLNEKIGMIVIVVALSILLSSCFQKDVTYE